MSVDSEFEQWSLSETFANLGHSVPEDDHVKSARKETSREKLTQNDSGSRREEWVLDHFSEGFFDPSYEAPDPSPPPNTAAAYCRVSSNEQAKEGHSLEFQSKQTKNLIEEHGLKHAYGPFKDEGESGTNFDRPAFLQVMDLAKQGKISHIVVTHFDRFSRDASQCISLLKKLEERCGVTLVTAEQGEVGMIGNDYLMTLLQAYMSEQENQTRSKKSQEVTVDKFREGHYEMYYQSAPFGYRENKTDDCLQLEPVQDECEVVRELFETFRSSNDESPYKRTLEQVSAVPEEMGSSDLKKLLQDSIYIGVPSASVSNCQFYDRDEVVFYDSNLQMVNRDTFVSVQEKIRSMKRKDDSQNADPVEDFFGTYDANDILELTSFVAFCSDCERRMGRNGTKESGGKKVQVFRCSGCETQQRIPTYAQQCKLRARARDSGIQFER